MVIGLVNNLLGWITGIIKWEWVDLRKTFINPNYLVHKYILSTFLSILNKISDFELPDTILRVRTYHFFDIELID